MKNIMKMAWEIAQKGRMRFGGKVSEYLSEAMKIAWAYHRKIKTERDFAVRLKKFFIAAWKQQEEKLTATFGTFEVFYKVMMRDKLGVYVMNETQKIELSDKIAKLGY